jgi:A/G-specific adenine glycosylase
MPWRAPPGEFADPYHVWLSEIMLQQTVVAAVIPYFNRLLEAFPTIADLAAAPGEQVSGLWAGLGYYARARNLHECAKRVAAMGGFPADIAQLRALPGIGPYTANAIGAIAFGIPALPVDGNIERVAARIFAISDPVPGAKKQIAAAAGRFMDDRAAQAHPGDFAQALFDLGATICTPKSPSCLICPWQAGCAAHAAGIAASLPARAAKISRPGRFGAVFVLFDEAGLVGLRRRAPLGMLGGMLEFPGTAWDRRAAMEALDADAMMQAAPAAADWREAGEIMHVFTHFSLRLRVLTGQTKTLPQGLIGLAPEAAELPSLMRKALDQALIVRG